MKNVIFAILTILVLGLSGCGETPSNDTSTTETESVQEQRAKFEPEDGKCILFVGQELEAIGGLGAMVIMIILMLPEDLPCILISLLAIPCLGMC